MYFKRATRLLFPLFKKRITAWLIDHAIVSVMTLFMCLSFSLFFSALMPRGTEFTFIGLMTSMKFIFLFSYLTYYFFCNYFFDGTTVGLKSAGLQLNLSMNYQVRGLDLNTALRRTVGTYICLRSYFLLFCTPLITQSRKSFSDYLSDTYVTFSKVESSETKKVA